jgi:hypothetical protein
LQKSQVNGDPFFTLSQNALADGMYLKYLRSMYGDRIYLPTDQDLQNIFKDYSADAKRRLKDNQLKPGENVKVDEGRVEITGMAAVMQLNGLLAKTIFDKTPDCDFYIEVSFPLDWMYPNLEPHGLIFKIDRQPLSHLSEDIISQDRQYWNKLVAPMIGDWLKADTSVPEVIAFAEKVTRHHDLSGFTGDPEFVQNDYSCEIFSAARAHIADLYVWRLNQATDADEKDRLASAADFAFRQALALCPFNKDAAKAYEDFLKNQNRPSDAALIHGMTLRFPNR